MISKIHPVRSHSGAAEGGINAALGNASEDDPEKHAFDTVKGSDYIGDQDAIEILAAEAPGDIFQLENWGAVFSRRDDGKLAQRPFGAAGIGRVQCQLGQKTLAGYIAGGDLLDAYPVQSRFSVAPLHQAVQGRDSMR
jgi:succinate dehydrogenase / fumarate reductase flavoprotein subunit